MRAALALPLLLATAQAEPGYHYHLDGDHSEVSARVAVLGLASKTARFPRMSGAITLQPARPEAIDLAVELDARALTAGDSATLRWLKGPDFFDVEHFPTVRFTGQRMAMTGPVTATIEGTLTARGVTRPATLKVAFTRPPARESGRDPVQLRATTTIDRRQFGMTAYSLFVGRKVTITINARMVPG